MPVSLSSRLNEISLNGLDTDVNANTIRFISEDENDRPTAFILRVSQTNADNDRQTFRRPIS